MGKRKSNHSHIIIFSIILMLFCLFIIPASGGTLNTGGTNTKWVCINSASQQNQPSIPELQVVQSNDKNLTVRLKTDGFLTNERNENGRIYTSLHMGKYNSDMKLGYPHLPAVRQYIEIPPGKTVQLKVIPGQAVMFNNISISPVQLSEAGFKNAVERLFYCDETVYNTDNLFPLESVYLDKKERLRGHDIALLHICPFQYNPVRNVLYVYPNMEIQLTFIGETRFISQRVQSPQFNSFIQGFALNAGTVSKNQLSEVSGISEGADFLIITAPEFLAAANALHDHKETLGINTVVKTTNDTGITNQAIKNYIQNAYETWLPAPTYILLLGDVVYIPTHYRTANPYNTKYAIGTDLYYACVDGSDFQPDIFLGRISVDTLSEAQTVVQKIINYENNPPAPAAFYANAAVVSYFDDYNQDGYEDKRNVRTAEEIKDFLTIQGYNIERIYDLEYPAWSIPTNYNNDYYGNGEPLPPDLLISNGFSWDGDTEKVISTINAGISLMIYKDHYTEWGIDNSSVLELNNGELLPVVSLNRTEAGHFDFETDESYSISESLCELLLRKSNGGVAAVIGSSRIGYDGYSDFMEEGFIDSVWPGFLQAVPNPDGASSCLGAMLNHGKIAMDILWGDPRGLRLAEYEIVHLFGDPTMNLWTQQPGSTGTQTIKIQSDPGLGIPITSSQNDVNGNGNGVTFFTRTYPTGAVVTFTAPVTANGSNFLKWIVDGTVIENTSITLTMDQYHLATVFYADEKTLNITSYPVSSIPITISPTDNTGNGNGNTIFTRYYATGTEVTLTAPTGFNGRNFIRWLIDDVADENQTIQVTMNSDHTICAEFSILSADKKILIFDKNVSTSAQKIKTAIEANGFNTEYTVLMPKVIYPQLYPAIFVVSSSLSEAECVRLTKYMDNGGNLYLENISDMVDFSWEFLNSYLGIKDIWGSYYTTLLSGMPGTFTNGFNFTFPEETLANILEWADEVTGSFVIWDFMYVSQPHCTGVAHDVHTFKTIGVGFNFGDLPQDRQTAVMEKYLNFFMLNHVSTPCIQVISPNGGESLTPGSIHNITWNAVNVHKPLKISLWKDSLPVGIIADQLDASRSYYLWQVGKYNGGTASPGTGYTLKVEEIGTGVCDLSNAAFTISAAASLNITSPNGSEYLTSGVNHSITWKSTNVSGTVKITLWKNDVLIGLIADGLDSSLDTYLWTVGNYIGGTASPGAGYKIKIEGNGTAVSDMGDNPFTILPSPTITVTGPNGSESLSSGTIFPITWNTTNINSLLKITLWKDGSQVGIIAHGIDPSKRHYSWQVGIYEGGIAAPGTDYKVKIEENKMGISDDSNAPFSIAEPPALIVSSPNGGDNLSLGASHSITWKSSHISGTLKISLWQNDVLIGVIADNINPAETSYQWIVGNYIGGTVSPGTGYKIKIEENGSAAADSSDYSFKISGASSITVVSPNGGENLTIGTTHQITWNAANVKRILKITLWKDGIQVGIIAGKIDQSRSSFPWKVGSYAGGIAPAGTGYQVKIEDEGTPFSDMSDSSFTLLAPPAITVNSPNGGENLINGTTHLITWQAVNINGTLKITLWNGDSFIKLIADNINPTATSYLWTINASSGVFYKIKIEENGTAVSDMSDGNFTISHSPYIGSIQILITPVVNSFILGQAYEISWNSENIKRSLKITLWKDGTLVGIIADYLDPKVKSYYWEMGTYIGGVVSPGTGYKVKVEEHDTGVSDISEEPFTILPIPAITVTSPAGGEELTRGTTFNITWEASNIPWALQINLLKNNVKRGTIKYNIAPGVTSYLWTVGDSILFPGEEGSGYQIELNLEGTDFSSRSNYFAIYYPPSLTLNVAQRQ